MNLKSPSIAMSEFIDGIAFLLKEHELSQNDGVTIHISRIDPIVSRLFAQYSEPRYSVTLAFDEVLLTSVYIPEGRFLQNYTWLEEELYELGLKINNPAFSKPYN